MLTLVSPEGRQEVQNQAYINDAAWEPSSRVIALHPYAPRLHEERRRFPMFYPIVLRSSQVPSSVTLRLE